MNLDPSIFVSLALLFGIAAHFRAMDGYSFLRRLISVLELRIGVLYAVIVVAALISPFILNDVVILVLTPVLVKYAKQFDVDIAPLVVAEISFTNITSSLTPFGNPQNILLWEATGISARDFVSGTWLPILASVSMTCLALYPFRKKLGGARELPAAIGSSRPAVYLISVGVIVFILDIVGVPSVAALGVAFLLGFAFTFRSLRGLAKEFDLRSLLILYLLVGSVAVAAAAVEPILLPFVSPVASGSQPYSAAFVGLTSNLISNVPATQLVLGTVGVSAGVAPKIAVEAGLAGNLDPIASFANVLALMLVRRGGLPIKRAILLQLAIGAVSFIPALF